MAGLNSLAVAVSMIFHFSFAANINFITQPKNVLAAESSRAEFSCHANSANPAKEPLYFWKHNGTYIPENNQLGILIKRRTLVINHVNSIIHQGKYQCVAFLPEYGAIISLPAKLEMEYLSITNVYNSTYSVTNGAYLLIKAPEIKARPFPFFSWEYQERNGILVPVNKSETYTTKKGDLLVPSISMSFNTTFHLYAIQSGSSGIFLAAVVTVKVIGSRSCPDPTVKFLQQERARTVIAGQNVTLECLAVATHCQEKVMVTWKKSSVLIASGRKLHLKQIQTFQGEGIYTCTAKVGNRPSVTYGISVTVSEKPEVQIRIPQDQDIASVFSLSTGLTDNARTIEWYTNGEQITSNTGLYQIQANNWLKFAKPSPSVQGVYQVFFSNDAGTTIQTINIYVAVGFGAKISGLSGNVTFKPSPTATNPSGTTYASWLIQIPAVRTVYVTLTSPPKCSQDGLTSLHVYQGSTANGIQVARVCKSPTYTMGMKVMKGPFITLVLVTRNLKDSGFVVHFDVNRPVTTLIPPIPTTLATTTTTVPMVTSSSKETTTTTITTVAKTTTGAGPKSDPRKDKSSPIGAIIGGVVAVVAVVAVILGLIWCRRRKHPMKSPESTPGNSSGQKHDEPPPLPRNTYMYRRPESHQDAPCFTVGPSGRPMPDVIPSYHFDPESIEMQNIGQGDDNGNATYETVGTRVSTGYDGNVIGNLAYQTARAPKQVAGKRIPSAPGKPYSKFIAPPGMNERPRDLALQQQQQAYDSVDSGGEYLSPVETLPRSMSGTMQGRPLPSPTDSKGSSLQSGPYYHLLEAGGSQTYESPDDVIDEMKMLRNPSDKSENRYAPLQEHKTSVKENTYEPLTLDRNVKMPSDMDKDKNQGHLPCDSSLQSSNSNNQAYQEPNVSDDDYSEPYESSHPTPSQRPRNNNNNNNQPSSDVDDDYTEPYESSQHAPSQRPLNNNNQTSSGGPKQDEGQSGDYETLDDVKTTIEKDNDYQSLTLPRGQLVEEDDTYAEI